MRFIGDILQILFGWTLPEQAAQKAMDVCDPVADLRGDVEYKTHMGGEMTRRAIRTAIERAQG